MDLKQKAKKLGATNLFPSKIHGKRFTVIYKNKIIHFGSDSRKTYYDIKDNRKRDAYYARHSMIKNKDGNYVINDKNSPSYWSAKLLW